MKGKTFLILIIIAVLYSCNNYKEIVPPKTHQLKSIIKDGDSLFGRSKYSQALDIYDSAILIIKNEGKDSILYYKELAKIFNKKGKINQIQGQLVESWNNFQLSLKITDSNRKYSQEIFASFFGLGVLFFYYQENNEMALLYFTKNAKDFRTEKIDSAMFIYSSCEAYIKADSVKSAEDKLEELLAFVKYDTVSKKFNIIDSLSYNKITPMIWESIAKIRNLNHDTKGQILKSFDYSLSLNGENNQLEKMDMYQIAGVNLEKSRYLLKVGDFQEALKCTEKSYCISSCYRMVYIKMNAARQLSNIYDSLDNIDSAYKYLAIADKINSSFNNKELSKLSFMKINQDLQKESNRVRNFKVLLLAIVIALIILIISLIFSNITKNKIKDYTGKLSSQKKQLELQKNEMENAFIELNNYKGILELLMKFSQDGIYLIQEDKFILVNESFCKITGFDHAELINMPFLKIVFEDDKKVVAEEVKKKLLGEKGEPIKFRIYTKSNELLRVKSFSGPLVINGVPSVYGYLRDITTDETLEEFFNFRIFESANELNKAIEKEKTLKEELNVALDNQKTLLDLVIHEIDSPTTAIRGKAEIIKLKLDDSSTTNINRKKKLDDIIDFCNLLFMLTGNVALSRNEIDLDKVETSFNSLEHDLLYNAIYVIRSQARNKELPSENIMIKSFSYPFFIKANKSHFQQVFFNLLSNAVKYADSDPKKFRIIIEQENSATGIKLYFCDWGIGIPIREEGKIFIEKIRGSNVQNRRGMGIGLSVIKKILDAYNCKIRVVSNFNPTKFEVFIPNSLLITHKP